MRKIAVLLSLLFFCLLCGWNESSASVHATVPEDAYFTLDRSTSDEWLCQQEYNSDLGMPRAAAELQPASVTPPSLRGGRCFLRLGVKCGVVSGREGNTVCAVSEYRSVSIFLGSCAVDYYVFRLRRLII